MDKIKDYLIRGVKEPNKPGTNRMIVLSRRTGYYIVDNVNNIPAHVAGMAIAYNSAGHEKRILIGAKPGGETSSFLFTRPVSEDGLMWDCYPTDPKFIRSANYVFFQNQAGEDVICARVRDMSIKQHRIVEFDDYSPDEIRAAFAEHGRYAIQKGRTWGEAPKSYEPTITAHSERPGGSVLAPDGVDALPPIALKQMELNDCELYPVFAPWCYSGGREYTVNGIDNIRPQEYEFRIPEATMQGLSGKRVFVVGLNVLRALNRCQGEAGLVAGPSSRAGGIMLAGRTNHSENLSAMITRLHSPGSLEHIETASFAGFSQLRGVYEAGKRYGWGFGQFGDWLLIV